MTVKIDSLASGKMLVERCEWLTQRMLHHWMQTNPRHFRERCIVRVGGKYFFDIPSFEAWIDEHRSDGATNSNAAETVISAAL